MPQDTCSIDGCDKQAVGRGWCAAHWYRWSKHGDPLAEKPIRSFAVDHDDGTRTCSGCGDRLSIEMFDKVATAARGRRSTCKRCRAEQMRAWYAANRQSRVQAAQARRDEDPELYRERDRKRAQQPARREAHALQTAKRRSRLGQTKPDPGVTRDNLRLQYGDECFYCLRTMTFAPTTKGAAKPLDLATLDHVHPVSQGGSHTWDNVVLACWSCNSSKRHSSVEEWMARRAEK